MKIGSKEEYIEIDLLERIPEGVPYAGDVRVKVALGIQDFSGSYNGVWFEFPENGKIYFRTRNT